MDQSALPLLWMSLLSFFLGGIFIWASFKARNPISSQAIWMGGGIFIGLMGWPLLCGFLGEEWIGSWAMLVWLAPLFVGSLYELIDHRPRPPYPGDIFNP